MVLVRDLIFQNIKVVLDWLILVSLVNEPVQHILGKVYGFRAPTTYINVHYLKNLCTHMKSEVN